MWPKDVAVATPTVPQRAAPWQATLRQWHALGVAPVVHHQPDTWPLSHASHRAAVDILLTTVLDQQPDATHILLAEDDIDIDPALPHVLPDLLDDRTTTLWTNGTRFYPHHIRHLIQYGQPLPRTTVPVPNLHGWWGTQAVLIPRRTATEALAYASDGAGWDIHLRNWLQHTRTRLWVAVPNLVQHRGVPSLASARGGGMGRSTTYNWPVEDTP